MISSFLFLSLFSSSSLLCSCLRSSSFKSSIQQSCYINKRSLYSTSPSPSSYSFVLHSTSVDDPPKSTSLRTKSNVTKAVIACTAVTSNLGLYKHASASSSPTPTSSTNTYSSDNTDVKEDDTIYGKNMPLGPLGYTTLGDQNMCRLLNGMWQVSGYHGYEPQKDGVVASMAKCADAGYTTFDLADIYGPAEEFVGSFRRGNLASSMSKDCQFFTKWVPRPQEITRKIATAAIDRSLRRMNTDQLDLVQFHWWDYKNMYYYDAMSELMHLKEDGKIRNIGLTNFDTEHMLDLIDESAPIVSNQVAFSIIDTRPLKLMSPACLERGVKLLVYGSLMGGFLSSAWLNKPAPKEESLTNVSLRKYLPWIYYWGGWDLFQELLRTLDTIAKKYSVSISNVAVRWVLDQPAVGGAIIGVRFGLRDHLTDNKKIFSFTLDKEDLAAISAVQRKSKDLMNVFGDCGGEYRKRA